MNVRTVVRIVVFVVSLFFIVLGIWALVGPDSFFDKLATFYPKNIHLLHDVGAFQLGIGATLLFALFRRDALGVVLMGTSVGAVAHEITHIVDRSRGASNTQNEPYLLGLLALVLVVTTALHLSQRQR